MLVAREGAPASGSLIQRSVCEEKSFQSVVKTLDSQRSKFMQRLSPVKLPNHLVSLSPSHLN